MAIVETSIEGTRFKLAWVAPFDNYEPISRYEIMIRKPDGTFYKDEVNCPGLPVDQNYCYIEMDTLRVDSGLVQGDLVRAKIRAFNLNGWGAFSQLNFIGSLIETRPL
jgi:hypothetical protein